ncbi:MAG: GntR family transcriptional regulator [Acidobacteria bacterium]|nr:GntR family transcriptional regulator [Acidobacteriota bacterium]
MILSIDPDSPIPLYHQIAQALRAAIAAGELAPGDALQPMRQAAEKWGVNIHTVRHAYAALAREGLVERNRGPRGTRIAEHDRGNASRAGEIDAFLDRVRWEAAERFGMGSRSLAAALLEAAPAREADRPTVYVVECSEWQCASHTREIAARFRVHARPWPLALETEPPEGPVISTYFHYNDLRRMWPRRLGRIRFLTIYPDPALLQRLDRVSRVIVCEHDPATAGVVAADLTALCGSRQIRIDSRVTGDPAAVLRSRRGPPVLFTPRVWASLPEAVRVHPRALELRYVFDPAELQALGGAMGWEPVAAPKPTPGGRQ